MPKILDIVTYPDDILRMACQEIKTNEINTKNFGSFLADMKKTMSKKDGVGLAAPQVGKNIRVVVINTKNKIVAMINPALTHRSLSKEAMEEGCLSVPDFFGNVMRHKKVTCLYTDENGAKMKVDAEGLMARVIQHEIDHLDGVLFIDKAKDLKKIN
jgi:peptide deformylase